MLVLNWLVRSRSFGLPACAVALIVGAWSTPLFAAEAAVSKAEREERKALAEALVEEALAAEVDGRDEDRVELLAKAEALAPDLPAIQWHRGMVLVDDKWTPAEDVAVSSDHRAVLDEYVAKRDAAENSLPSQFALAKWCQGEKLFEQERAHLVRVLMFDPNHETARARLGFVRLGDAWVGREEIALAIAEEAKTQAVLKKHAGSLHDILRSLGDDNPAARARVLERIRAARDAEMIPALERLVASIDEEAAMAVLEALSAMPEKEASLSLARLAVTSPSLEVRSEATQLLKERPFDQYVPELLASMTGSLRSEWTVARGRGGQLFLRQATYVETMRSIEVAVQDTGYVAYDDSALGAQRLGAAIAARSVAAMAANRDAEARAALNLAFDKVRHAERLEVNARIGEILESVANQKFGADAEQWWNWWNQHNEVMTRKGKPFRVQYASQTVAVPLSRQSTSVQFGEVGVHDSSPPVPCPPSCFVAGTPVLTNRGDVAIEQVRVGDLVLAQDVETGELAFKPVLETTVRPPAEILRIEYEGGSLRSTGGHPFWVSGEGWVHARRLQSGMELHTTNGTVRVSQVVSDREEPAYNLIVADFANYFVGEARILSHDNSSRLPTDAIVPGLVQR